jgi:predicted metalloprotease with PDZ domain
MMEPRHRAALLFAVAFISSESDAQVQAQSALASAPIANVRYDVSFNRESAIRRTMRVEMTFDVLEQAPLLLSLPAWTPGAYEMSNFAQWLSGFSATAVSGGGAGAGTSTAGGAGTATTGGATADTGLMWDKIDHDTWRIIPAGAARAKVSFDLLADSLDNAMAWARSDFLFFNGTNVFLYPEGRAAEWPATVTVHTDSTWRVATGMQPGPAPRTYTASNYHDLVDMPFFVGRFDFDSAMVSERWLRLATYPVLSVEGRAREAVWQQLKGFVPVQAKVFGEVPWQTYTVMQIADESYGGASGLEHQNSHVNVITPYAVGHPFMASLYAHEIFHAWNVKRLRPAELWPYKYDRVQPTTQLWISEGITDYYADLSIVRSKLADSSALLGLTTEKINEVNGVPPVALEDASLSTWIQPRDGTGTIYYAKGALAGFMLDILIRDATDNRASLDEVMREMYTSTYKQGRGFTAEEWWSTVSRIAGGRSFADFNAKYVDGREPYPWNEVLPLAGLELAADSVREPRLGIATVSDSIGVRVEEVEPGGPGAIAGVRAGDYIIALGELMLSDPGFMDKFRAKYSTGESATIPIRVQRGGQPVTLAAQTQLHLRVEHLIRSVANASAKAAMIRNGIFAGTVGG